MERVLFERTFTNRLSCVSPCTRRLQQRLYKVSLCVRTKDSGRFLPEWIAFHYAVGVNEITVYDDDSVDDTKQVRVRTCVPSTPQRVVSSCPSVMSTSGYEYVNLYVFSTI